MTVREIKKGIYAVGTQDWDRKVFDDLIPLPNGTSYNAYVIQGTEKTAVIDTVDPAKDEEFITNLIRLNLKKVDYIIVNHAEQDHAGSLPILLELFPNAPVLCSEKCRELLFTLLAVPQERCQVVTDGETIALGGRTLEFLITPWVHWPETMLTYCPEEELLFSCDLFGSHYATENLYLSDYATGEILARRFYAGIMMPFRTSIKGYLDRLSEKRITTIAPSHGPLITPASFIINLYRAWTADTTLNTAVIVYVSMHGSVKKMVQFLEECLTENGVGVSVFNVATADTGAVASALVDASTVIFATPTVLFGPHPAMVTTAYLANAIRPKTKYAAIIGSFGWGGKTVDVLTSMLTHIKPELLDPVFIKGAPNAQTQHALSELAGLIAEKHHNNKDILT